MGLLTDFFVATRAQLEDAFTGWLSVASEPLKREIKNPFTGKTQIVDEWPTEKPVGNGDAADIPNIKDFAHAELKGIEDVKLATLFALISSEPYEKCIGVLAKPALVHPNNHEMGLHQLPDDLSNAIAVLDDSKISSVSQKWQETDEMKLARMRVDDCAFVLRELRRLACLTRSPDSHMYLLWSL